MSLLKRSVICVLAAMAVLIPTAPAFASVESGTGVRGTLRAEGEPVQGVSITVLDEDGNEVETVESDEEGEWIVDLGPLRGITVRLDIETLPEELALREGDEGERSPNIIGGQVARVLFNLDEDTRVVTGFWSRFASLTVDGIRFGLIIGMMSIGLSLIFGTTGLVNFAHGELVAFGAIVAWFIHVSPAGPQIPLIGAAALAVLAGGTLGGAIESGVFGPLRKRGTGLIAMLVISIGMSLLLRHLLLNWFGGRSLPYRDYAIQSPIVIGPVSITPKNLWIIGLSILVLVGIGLVLQKTRLGKAMRAVADNRDLAEASGINVRRIILIIWIMGGALAALGGVFQGVDQAVAWNMGFLLLLLLFAGVILGGIGTAYGALVGSLIVGVLVQVSTLFVAAELKNAFALGTLILVLLFRPQGILGRRERIG